MENVKKKRLSNGLTVLYRHRNTDTVTVLVQVGTGSDNEPYELAGISHFLEHMVFEGTKKRTSQEISEAIENVGGELNAMTTNERTAFYAKVPKKHLELALEILADIIQNPTFEKKIFEKEKRVVLEEIKMINDQPLHYQWILLEKTLFKRHPAKNPVYGREESVKKMTVEQMKRYYQRWYVPNNIIVSIVGNAQEPTALVGKYFGKMKKKQLPKMQKTTEPRAVAPETKKEKRKINQAYMLIGYKTVERAKKEAAALDVMATIFHKGISGRVTNEIRVKRGLAYAAGAHHVTEKTYGFFVFYLNTEKKNIEECKNIISDEIRKLDNLEKKEIEEAKEHMIGKMLVAEEDTHDMAEQMAYWELIGKAEMEEEYRKEIKKVTKKDILKARDKYMKNHTLVLLGDV